MKHPHWIKKAHLWGEDEYVCSACGASYDRPRASCPRCGADMQGEQYDPTFVDEAEVLDMIFGDHW